jgi:hypothetical protein
MKTASSFNTSSDTVAALKEAYADLENKPGGSPSWMAVHGTYQHSGEAITTTLTLRVFAFMAFEKPC